MGLYFPLPFLLPIFNGGEKKMKRKWLKKAAVTLILAAALIGTSGCGADKAAKAAAGLRLLPLQVPHTMPGCRPCVP